MNIKMIIDYIKVIIDYLEMDNIFFSQLHEKFKSSKLFCFKWFFSFSILDFFIFFSSLSKISKNVYIFLGNFLLKWSALILNIILS